MKLIYYKSYTTTCNRTCYHNKNQGCNGDKINGLRIFALLPAQKSFQKPTKFSFEVTATSLNPIAGCASIISTSFSGYSIPKENAASKYACQHCYNCALDYRSPNEATRPHLLYEIVGGGVIAVMSWLVPPHSALFLRSFDCYYYYSSFR
jgi:hypothetical protein